jgi:hypothetical protein
VVESDPDRVNELEERFGDNELVEIADQDAEEFLDQNDIEGLIYDATSTNERLNKVTEAVLENLDNPEDTAYWSEKPVSDEIQEIDRLGAETSMDLIENFSLQKQSIIDDLDSHGYDVESISTWRTSKTDKQVQLDEDGDIDLKRSRNLFKNNAGSTKDKGAHDWGNIELTLESTGQDKEIEIDEESSEYRVVEVEKEDETVSYTESGEEVNKPYEGEERLNDGFARIKGSAGDVDLQVVTSLADWPEDVNQEINQLYDRFKQGIEDELGDVDLIYGDEGNEEIRVQHLEARDEESGEKIEYLVSTGKDMFTLKRTETEDGEESYECLAQGGTDFLASYLEEGLESLQQDDYEQTVTPQTARKTGEVLEKAGKTGYENRGEPISVTAPKGSNLRAVLEK